MKLLPSVRLRLMRSILAMLSEYGTRRHQKSHGSCMFVCFPHLRTVAFFSSQEYCLDLFQPSGAGRKKRDLGVAGEASVVVRSEELVKREPQRNFFPVKNLRRRKKKGDEQDSGVDFKENVGVTVIVPGGTCVRKTVHCNACEADPDSRGQPAGPVCVDDAPLSS